MARHIVHESESLFALMEAKPPGSGRIAACPVCKKDFHPRAYLLLKGMGRYCSLQCVGIAKRIPAKDRFWKYVEKTDGCWLWRGGISTRGYGAFTLEGRKINAHRACWILLFGPIVNGLIVCHKCDNTICVNPEHLFLGTNKDNTQDCMRKGRLKAIPPPPSKGEDNYCAKLTEAEVLDIRARSGNGCKTRVLANEYGVCMTSIQRIKSKKSWAHLDNTVWKGVDPSVSSHQ